MISRRRCSKEKEGDELSCTVRSLVMVREPVASANCTLKRRTSWIFSKIEMFSQFSVYLSKTKYVKQFNLLYFYFIIFNLLYFLLYKKLIYYFSIISIQWYHVDDVQRKKKATNCRVRFSPSLWSAISCQRKLYAETTHVVNFFQNCNVLSVFSIFK